MSTPPVTDVTSVEPLQAEVDACSWYQSIRLPGGIVTPGNFDTLSELDHIRMPASLAGKRCLDVGTADGFWAFEMERRGASEVIAVDIRDPARLDWPGTPKSDEQMRELGGAALNKHVGFEVAHRAFASEVRWRELSAYDLAPDLVGEFDFVFIGSLLLHLRDPVGALMAIRSVARGDVLSVDAISALLTLLHPSQPIARFEAPGWPLWWVLNRTAYLRLFDAAGLRVLHAGRPFFLRTGPGFGATPRSRRRVYGRLQSTSVARFGIPHAWVLARRAE
jgi:tRNA (mo5U34)-methyltransferase